MALDEEIEFQGLRDYGFSCFSVFLPVCLSPCVSLSLCLFLPAFFFFLSLCFYVLPFNFCLSFPSLPLSPSFLFISVLK